MKWNSILQSGGLALAAVATFGPAEAQAQSLGNTTAYYSAECRGQCDILRFVLTVPSGPAYINMIDLISYDSNKWRFGHLLGVQNGQQQDLGWWSDALPDGLRLWGPGTVSDPMIMYVKMSKWGNQSELNSLGISGTANTQSDGLGRTLNYSATVTPEPASMLLLGTGLAGVVGAARRRRRNADV